MYDDPSRMTVLSLFRNFFFFFGMYPLQSRTDDIHGRYFFTPHHPKKVQPDRSGMQIIVILTGELLLMDTSIVP